MATLAALSVTSCGVCSALPASSAAKAAILPSLGSGQLDLQSTTPALRWPRWRRLAVDLHGGDLAVVVRDAA